MLSKAKVKVTAVTVVHVKEIIVVEMVVTVVHVVKVRKVRAEDSIVTLVVKKPVLKPSTKRMELVKGTGELLLTKLLLRKIWLQAKVKIKTGPNALTRTKKRRKEKSQKKKTPNFMTLEEYKALKSQINKRNDFNIRRP